MKKKTKLPAAPKEAQKPSPQLVIHRCRVGHSIPMLPNALRVTVTLKDGNGDAVGNFQTNQLCPACVVNILNQLAETYPVQPPATAPDAPIDSATEGA